MSSNSSRPGRSSTGASGNPDLTYGAFGGTRSKTSATKRLPGQPQRLARMSTSVQSASSIPLNTGGALGSPRIGGSRPGMPKAATLARDSTARRSLERGGVSSRIAQVDQVTSSSYGDLARKAISGEMHPKQPREPKERSPKVNPEEDYAQDKTLMGLLAQRWRAEAKPVPMPKS